MLYSFLIICSFMVTTGLISFVLNYSHLLNSLLSLEMISVSIYLMVSMIFLTMGLDLFYLLYFLIMVVSEGVLGLSLLIVMTYTHGEDYLKTLHTVVC
uniref:NADH dehydrogenase subunit 4L n=1 Tax=Haustorioides koreanus TaxID=2729224 RepID=A0A6M3RLX0_9CRUS|nr:NADH dehydrogenase subunit 4L [Haustorioides koreanus]